jgi:hypothetical protein
MIPKFTVRPLKFFLKNEFNLASVDKQKHIIKVLLDVENEGFQVFNEDPVETSQDAYLDVDKKSSRYKMISFSDLAYPAFDFLIYDSEDKFFHFYQVSIQKDWTNKINETKKKFEKDKK